MYVVSQKEKKCAKLCKTRGYTFATRGYTFANLGYTFATRGYTFATLGYTFAALRYTFEIWTLIFDKSNNQSLKIKTLLIWYKEEFLVWTVKCLKHQVAKINGKNPAPPKKKEKTLK